MLKIFSIAARLLPRLTQKEGGTEPNWVRDLLRHPDIARMDARELGDLPFPIRQTSRDARSGCEA